MTRERGGGQRSEPGREAVEPVYMNVAGHFACLLLDDDAPLPVSTRAENTVLFCSKLNQPEHVFC